MIAVLPIRNGILPHGALDCIDLCGGRTLLIGSQTARAAEILDGVVTQGWRSELGVWSPAAWTAQLAPWLTDEPVVVLPASPDGRDLAPRLSHALERPLYAGVIDVRSGRVTMSRWSGRLVEEVSSEERCVITLQPQTTSPTPPRGGMPVDWQVIQVEPAPSCARDADSLEVLPPDAQSIDLAEAEHLWAGGAGLENADRYAQLTDVAGRLGASVGATRVVTDRGWTGHERQIGTTGVVVQPRWYVAFGVSGAVQHTSGLGHPEHVISVNTDPSCPMMQWADLAIVADANAVLEALGRLTERHRSHDV